MKTYTASLLSIVLAAAAPSAASAATLPYSNLLVFGDSLVDAGNAQIASLARGLPDPAPATAGYFQGRFSNGPTFADYLNADIAGVPTAYTRASFTPMVGGNNYGFGGAKVDFTTNETRPSFLTQLGQFAATNQPIAADTLVLVTFGGNDVRELVGVNGDFTFESGLADFRSGLLSLTARGARNIVVTGLPDIGFLPDTIGDVNGDPAQIKLASDRSTFLNAAFEGVTTEVAGLTGADLRFFDLLQLNRDLVADPGSFGLPGLNTTTPCQAGGETAVLGGCQNYLYFDAVHPTTSIHRLIADRIGADLNAGVPEPATWAMMLAGFGLVGGMARRRRGVPLLAA